MNYWHKILLTIAAIPDAKAGLHLGAVRIMSLLGPRPEFSPVNNFSHGQAVEDLRSSFETKEYKDDLDKMRQAGHRHGFRILNLIGAIACIACEFLGAVLVVNSLGYENPERIIFGGCLAFCLLVITHKVFHPESNRFSAQKDLTKKLTQYGYFIAYGALVAAIAVSRRLEKNVTWWEMILTTAMTIGPAWVASSLLSRFQNGAAFRLRERQLVKQIHGSERKQNGATNLAKDIARKQTAWDKSFAQYNAIYNAAHENAAKRRK